MKIFPLYLLIDTSGSMQGEAFASVKYSIDLIFRTLKSSTIADDILVSVIETHRYAEQVFSFKSLEHLSITLEIGPHINTPSFLGSGLTFLRQKLVRDMGVNSGAYKPFVMVLTDGDVSDRARFLQECKRFSQMNLSQCLILHYGADISPVLKKLSQNIMQMELIEQAELVYQFRWVES